MTITTGTTAERWHASPGEDSLTRQLRLLVRGSLSGTPEQAWAELTDLGAIDFDVPMALGGLELGSGALAVLCEEVGASTQPVPLVDALVTARLLVATGQRLPLERLRRGVPVAVAGRLPAPRGVALDRPVAVRGRFDTTLGPFSTGVEPHGLLVVVQGEFGPAAHLLALPATGIELRPLPDRGGGPAGLAVLGAVHLDAGDGGTASVAGEESVLEEIGRSAAVYQAALIAGLTAAALTALVARLRERRQFGKELLAHQVPRLRTAALLARLDVVRMTVAEAADGLDDGTTTAARAAGTLALAAETGLDVSRDAVHLHGAAGLGRSTTVAGCYRRLAWESLRCGPLPGLWRAAASCEGAP